MSTQLYSQYLQPRIVAINSPVLVGSDKETYFNILPFMDMGDIAFLILYADYFHEGSLENDLSSWVEDYLNIKFTKNVFRITDRSTNGEKRLYLTNPIMHKNHKNIDGNGTSLDDVRNMFDTLTVGIRKFYRNTQTHDLLLQFKEEYTLSKPPKFVDDKLYLELIPKVYLGV